MYKVTSLLMDVKYKKYKVSAFLLVEEYKLSHFFLDEEYKVTPIKISRL